MDSIRKDVSLGSALMKDLDKPLIVKIINIISEKKMMYCVFYLTNMKKVIFILLSILSLLSCQSEKREIKEIKEMYGREITFVKGYETLSTNDSLSIDSIMQKTIKVVSYIENFRCTDCTFKMLIDWKETIDMLGEDVEYLIVIHAENKEELEISLKIQQIHIPIIYYQTDTFKRYNKLDVLARNRIFLLDKNNKIVSIGEPFSNDALFEVYKKNIVRLKNNNHLDTHQHKKH